MVGVATQGLCAEAVARAQSYNGVLFPSELVLIHVMAFRGIDSFKFNSRCGLEFRTACTFV